jgi:hypothetical protein
VKTTRKTAHSETRRWATLRHRSKGGRHHLRAVAERKHDPEAEFEAQITRLCERNCYM